MFLFQIGAIKSGLYRQFSAPNSGCFYSKLVRLKVVTRYAPTINIIRFLFQIGAIKRCITIILQQIII